MLHKKTKSYNIDFKFHGSTTHIPFLNYDTNIVLLISHILYSVWSSENPVFIYTYLILQKYNHLVQRVKIVLEW